MCIHARASGELSYIFAINDRRTVGPYLGQFGAVLERGVPISAQIVLRDTPCALYDAIDTRQLIVSANGGGGCSTELQIEPGWGKLLGAAPEAVAELARQLGLDQPTWQRYRTWVQGLLHGDMGESYAYGSPVGELVAERLAVTVPLALIAMALAVAMALAAGMFAAAHHNRAGDTGVMALVQLGIAVPNFWLAILLILLLSLIHI